MNIQPMPNLCSMAYLFELRRFPGSEGDPKSEKVQEAFLEELNRQLKLTQYHLIVIAGPNQLYARLALRKLAKRNPGVKLMHRVDTGHPSEDRTYTQIWFVPNPRGRGTGKGPRAA